MPHNNTLHIPSPTSLFPLPSSLHPYFPPLHISWCLSQFEAFRALTFISTTTPLLSSPLLFSLLSFPLLPRISHSHDPDSAQCQAQHAYPSPHHTRRGQGLRGEGTGDVPAGDVLLLHLSCHQEARKVRYGVQLVICLSPSLLIAVFVCVCERESVCVGNK
jgi:hypothetical protein